MSDHTKHAPDRIKKALAILAQNDNLHETSRITGIPNQTLFKWKIKYLHDPNLSLPVVRGLSRDQVLHVRRRTWLTMERNWNRIDKAAGKCKSPKELMQLQNMLWDKLSETGLMLSHHDGTKEPKKKNQPRKASDETLRILEQHPSGEGTSPTEERGREDKKAGVNNINVIKKNGVLKSEDSPEALSEGAPASAPASAP